MVKPALLTVKRRTRASIVYAKNAYNTTGKDPLPKIHGQARGVFKGSKDLAIDRTTGAVHLSKATQGRHRVTYIPSGSCPDTAFFELNIQKNIVTATAQAPRRQPMAHASRTDLRLSGLAPHEAAEVKVYTLLGNQVLAKAVQCDGQGAAAVYSTSLPEGICFVTISTPSGQSTLKIEISGS